MSGRITWFLMGCGTGSASYFMIDRWVLADVGKASKRALEVRDELIGTVVGSSVAKLASRQVNEALVAPIRDLRSNVSSQISDGLKLILGKIGLGGN